MSCARCEYLADQLADVHARLSAWEGLKAGEAREAARLDRLGRWQTRFRLSPSMASVLLALVERAGRPVTVEALKSAAASRPGGDHAREVESNLAQVMVHRLRKRLDHDGLGDAIQTVRGIGYQMPTLAAEVVAAMAGDHG